MALIAPTQEDGYGILQPVLTHQWKAFFPTLPDDASDMLCTQCIKCTLNLAAKTFEIHIQQPLGISGIFTSINLMAIHGGDIEVDHLGGGGIVSFYKVRGDLVDHQYELNYEKSAAAVHILKFENVVLVGDHIPPKEKAEPKVKIKAKVKTKKK